MRPTNPKLGQRHTETSSGYKDHFIWVECPECHSKQWALDYEGKGENYWNCEGQDNNGWDDGEDDPSYCETENQVKNYKGYHPLGWHCLIGRI
jgi:hypothetical protein